MLSNRQVYIYLPLSIVVVSLIAVVPAAIISVFLKELSERDWLQLLVFTNYPIALGLIYWLWRKKINIYVSLDAHQKLLSFATGILIGALVLFSVFCASSFLDLGTYHFHPHADSEWLQTTTFFVLILLVCFITSLSEELLFRGIFLRTLSKKTNTRIAIIYSSILFGLLHPTSSVIMMLYFVAGGVAFGTLYIRSGSLLLSVGMHFIINVFFYSTKNSEFNQILGISSVFTYELSGMKYSFFSYLLSAESMEALVASAVMLLLTAVIEIQYTVSSRRLNKRFA